MSSSSSYDLQPVSFEAPTDTRPFMRVSFRLPSTPRNNSAASAIYPATGLQLSFANNGHEPFMGRLTARDVEILEGDDATSSSGSAGEPRLCSFRIPSGEIPRFAFEGAGPETEVRLHAWRGEKWLGTWPVGKLTGLKVEQQ